MEDDATLFYQQGLASLNKEQYAEAVTLFRRALSFEQDNADVLIQLGYALLRSKRFSEAKTAYLTLLKSCPNNRDAAKNLGQTLIFMGDVESGLDELNKLRVLHPDDDSVYLYLGHAYRHLKEYDKSWLCTISQ